MIGRLGRSRKRNGLNEAIGLSNSPVASQNKVVHPCKQLNLKTSVSNCTSRAVNDTDILTVQAQCYIAGLAIKGQHHLLYGVRGFSVGKRQISERQDLCRGVIV